MSQKTSVVDPQPDQESHPSQYKRPPAEAVHVARMLSDSTPGDIEERIAQVSAVCRDKTQDEISVALHDNDFDPEKAAAVLLDESTEKITGEWTTTSRKGKKKQESEAPVEESASVINKRKGDRTKQQLKRAVRQAPKKVVDSFGGDDVVVIKHEGRTRSARGKPRIKADRGRGSRGRGFGRRGNSHSGYRGTREGKRGGFGRPPSSERLEGGTGPSSQLELPLPQSQVNSEEQWDSEDVMPSSQGSVLSTQNLLPSIQSPTHSTQNIVGPHEEGSGWEDVSLNNTHSSLPENLSNSITVGSPSSDLPPSSRPRVQFSGVDDAVEKKTKLKSRKAAKSNIPRDAVEMPSNTIEGLEIQFGNLGIGFGDSTSNSSSGVELQEDVPVVENDIVTMVTEPSVKTPPAEKDEFPHNLSVPDTSTTTSSFLGTDTQSLPAKIDPPPGLSRQVPPQGLHMPSSLPQSRGFQVTSDSTSQHTTQVSSQAPQINSKLQDSISKPTVTGPTVQLSLPSAVNNKTVPSVSQVQATKPGVPVANQQPMMYPTMMPHHYMMAPPPMQYYDNMYYHHVSSADYGNISRDTLVSFGDSKAVGSPSTVTQQQGAGMQQGQPHPVPIPYPYYGMGMYMGMPYSQQMGPKPASGGGFPTGNATTFPPSTTAFGGYEDQEYRFPTSSSVKTGGVTADGFKHQYDGKGGGSGGNFGYNMPMGGSGGYGYLHHLPYQTAVMPLPQEGGAGGTGRQAQAPKHSRNYAGTWGQASHST